MTVVLKICSSPKTMRTLAKMVQIKVFGTLEINHKSRHNLKTVYGRKKKPISIRTVSFVVFSIALVPSLAPL